MSIRGSEHINSASLVYLNPGNGEQADDKKGWFKTHPLAPDDDETGQWVKCTSSSDKTHVSPWADLCQEPENFDKSS